MQTRLLPLCGVIAVLAACGGGGGDSGEGGESPTGTDRVSITASAPTVPVPGGSTVQIEMVITNPGATTTTDIAASMALGSGLTKGAVSCIARSGAVCPATPADLRIPSLPAGGSLQFTMTALVAPGASGSIASTASVTAAGDAVTTNNSAPVAVTAYSADVRVTSATGGEFFGGSIATYSMTLSNSGPDTARNLFVQAAVGPGQALSSITCTASGAATCPDAPTPAMTIPTVPNGGSLTFTVSASIAPSTVGPISSTLHVSVEGDPVSSNNVATASATARIPTSPQSASFVSLRSDAGDYIGAGQSYEYNRASALIDVTADGGKLTVRIHGDQQWTGNFVLPSSQTQLSPGTYSNLRRFPFHDAAVGGLDWSGEGRGCNTLTGTLTIDSVTYMAGSLAAIDLRFEQHCEGMAPALRGQIHWVVDDDLRPPGPVNPPPAGLWSPAPGATPATGNYIYLQSDGGDFIGQGRTYTYTQANAVLSLTANGNQLSVGVNGNQNWGGQFKAMNILTTLEPGYYANLQRFPFHNPVTGGLNWSGEGRGCNTLTGWFAIDSITYSAGVIASIDLRFEQHCEGGTPALRGEIHWISGDTTQPTGPQVPPPDNLWAPAPGTTPASGNYVYLQSQPGDYIGAGATYTYTQANTLLNVTAIGARLNVGVNGDEGWSGDFQGMNTLSQLQPGYYGNLQRFPFHNPVLGGLSWGGEGRGCNTLTGWFAIDSITYAGGALASIDLRFEQHCEGVAPALRGKIHWEAGDTTQPPGPQNPPPPGLWAPAPGTTPASGNYVYLVSDAGDYIGQGLTHTYTGLNAVLNATSSDRLLSVSVRGDENWSGEFLGMNALEQLGPGYYGNLQRYPFNNPVTGGLSWSGESRGCNTLTGWFVIDSITYAGGALASIDLRFEQHCEGWTPALRGEIHWVR